MPASPQPAASRRRSALAGAGAALAWATVEPIDRRIFRCDYSDVAMLGKAVTRGPLWPVAGLLAHAVNGALFGLGFYEVRERTQADPVRLGVALALVENTALFPLAPFIDRFHPARGERDVAVLATPRGFAQATFRHALFGAVLGRLAG
jgi:ABC-type uncharacterized transport system permease subunit